MSENEDGFDYLDDEPEDREPECWHCHDTGRVVAADGYHEYLGYSYLPCPHCQFGATQVGDGPKSPFLE